MKDIQFTCKTHLIPHEKDGENVVAIRLNGTNTKWYLMNDEWFIYGPVADKLYAYESLGYSPKEMEAIIHKYRVNKVRDLALNSLYGTLGIPIELRL